MNVNLQSDLFIIPTENENSIIYSPLRGVVFQANQEATSIICQFLEEGKIHESHLNTSVGDHLIKLANLDVSEPIKEELHNFSNDAVFVLSQICNLNCTYCYAKNYHCNEVLSLETIKNVINSVMLNTGKEKVSFSFIGGGEPLATWDLLKDSINYIKVQSKIFDKTTFIGLATNGTMLNNERINFLKENKIKISISFDVLPDIQDKQRPFPRKDLSSFEVVNKNIKLLISNGIIPRIRSTITKDMVQKMPEMVEFVVKNYPEVKTLHLEPVTSLEDNNYDFFNSYLESFKKAKEIAVLNDLFIKNSITHSFSRIRSRFCNGELCITPHSDIVACHRISSKKEAHYKDLKIGKVTNFIEIDFNSQTEVLSFFEEKKLECATCFAKWHCGGGCPMFRITSTEKEFSAYCNFVRKTIKLQLEEKIQYSSLN